MEVYEVILYPVFFASIVTYLIYRYNKKFGSIHILYNNHTNELVELSGFDHCIHEKMYARNSAFYGHLTYLGEL